MADGKFDCKGVGNLIDIHGLATSMGIELNTKRGTRKANRTLCTEINAKKDNFEWQVTVDPNAEPLFDKEQGQTMIRCTYNYFDPLVTTNFFPAIDYLNVDHTEGEPFKKKGVEYVQVYWQGYDKNPTLEPTSNLLRVYGKKIIEKSTYKEEVKKEDTKLFIYNPQKNSLEFKSFTKIMSLGTNEVTMVNLKNGNSVVLKRKKSYKYNGTQENALNVIKSLINKCSVYLEQDLHTYLVEKVPNNIARLAFPSCYAFLMRKNTVVPVKVSFYYELESNRDRDAVKKLESERPVIEERIENAIREYYNRKNEKPVLDQDWKNKRNILYTGGSILYHDFDHSIWEK